MRPNPFKYVILAYSPMWFSKVCIMEYVYASLNCTSNYFRAVIKLLTFFLISMQVRSHIFGRFRHEDQRLRGGGRAHLVMCYVLNRIMDDYVNLWACGLN